MSLKDEVMELVSKIIKVPVEKLEPESGLSNLQNWDSMNHTLLILALEEAFNISFDFDELDQIVTIAAITHSLENKGVRR